MKITHSWDHADAGSAAIRFVVECENLIAGAALGIVLSIMAVVAMVIWAAHYWRG